MPSLWCVLASQEYIRISKNKRSNNKNKRIKLLTCLCLEGFSNKIIYFKKSNQGFVGTYTFYLLTDFQ